MGRVTKVETRELVYYIFSGTPRGVQKYLSPNLRAEFSGDIDLQRGRFSRGLYRPRIELGVVAMDLWRNSDGFKKKKVKIRPLFPELLMGPHKLEFGSKMAELT